MGYKVIALITLAQLFCIAAINADSTGDKKVDKQIPIVIKTPERNFDQPSLADFEKCSRDYDSCRQFCESSSNADVDCLEKCPKCPILVIQNHVVQGINDTDYRAMKPIVVNSTNIIRLTNEIHNIIDNNLGIEARNENNIHIHSRNSTVGGQFGYGYTEHGPCCLVVRNRDQKQRLCGQLCTARIMHARTVVQCGDEMDIETCKQVIEYKPHRRSRHSPTSTHNRCSYQQEWPFVSCRNRRQYDYCSPQCLELAYGYILRYGVPLHCVNCFKNFDRSGSNPPPLGYLPPPSLEDDDFRVEDGWKLEKSKCRNADGTISDDCIADNDTGSGDDGFLFPEDDRDRRYADAAFDSFQSLDTLRQRRNTFRRSKYSRRNKRQNEKE